MKTKSLIFFITLFSFFQFKINCFAQQVSTLDSFNITCQRSFQKNLTSGKNIIVLNKTYFEKTAFVSIDDILKYQGSIEVQQRGPAGSQADIIIRGGTFQQILILLDGVKLNDPLTGHFSGYIPIPASEIERIEIVKGPSAAMYGAEAVGGVINIISKTFFNLKKEKSKNILLGATIGEYNLLHSNASLLLTNKKLNASLSASSNNSDGQLLRTKNRGYYHNNLISGSIHYALKKNWSLLFRSSYDDRDFAAQNFYTTFKSDTATEQVSNWWNQLRLKKVNKINTEQFDVVAKKTTDHYLYNSLSIANENHSNAYQFNYIHQHQKNDRFNYLMGVSFDRKEIVSNDRGNHSNNNIAGFSSCVYNYKHLSITPGLRFLYDENYGFDYLPQLNIAFPLKHITFRGGVGKSIRGADFTERYNNYNKPLVKAGSIGNPDLVAEKSWSYELGLDTHVSNFQFNGTAFYRKQNQLIDFVNTNSNEILHNQNLVADSTYAYAINVYSIITKGLEFELKYNVYLSSKSKLSLLSNLQFLNSKSSNPTPSYYILSHAKFLTQQTILLDLKHLNFSVTSLYKERTAQSAPGINTATSPAYWLVNAKASYNYNLVNVFVSLNNIGDIQYSDLLGSKMPSRWLMSGINIHF